MRVRIGITTSFEDEEQRLHHAYVRAVETAGGLPFIVPMLADEEATRAFARELDGLVITGGPAVTNGLIGTLPDDLSEPALERSRSDRWLLDAFLESEKPVLGICYGMQLLNAVAGGTLYADAERQVEGALVHSPKRGGTDHAADLVPGSRLHQLMGGRDRIDVNSRHVQALCTIGEGLRVSATAPDGLVEAIENADATLVGVQFHPERMGAQGRPLFRHLVECAREHARRSLASPL